MVPSNLQSFLRRTTPSVPSRFLSKSSIHYRTPEWQFHGGKDPIEYFTLGDLWDCYDEWSAYGVGTPLRLEDHHQPVVQYYTPFLSGIQLYSGKVSGPRSPNSKEDSEFETDSTCSDGGVVKLSRSSSDCSNRTWDSEDSGSDQEVDSKIRERLGRLYFQYFETSGPHLRPPLRDMINKLSETYPGLHSLRSIDLSPASWMAIAWYPIYHIPAQRNPKELYSAFLTYHTLSSTFQGGAEELSMEKVKRSGCGDVDGELVSIKDEPRTLSLPPFGLAAYKMQTQIWINPRTEDFQQLTSLWSAAASWLRQLEAHHPDFDFFNIRTM
ncbi:unnamed protein product [Spirodela intermedia]|uniref:Uncharacterized protein n=1 Tax=Spirodela intermedia TaxID=51605 RepID=A0A7I8K3R4_SPIIN|nr:unnamed protein product [Spirodela intermedia]